MKPISILLSHEEVNVEPMDNGFLLTDTNDKESLFIKRKSIPLLIEFLQEHMKYEV